MTQSFGIYTDCYNSIIKELESGQFFPNMKAIRKQIREAKRSIEILTKGAEVFCHDLDQLAKTEERIQDARDKYNAMSAVYKYIQSRMK